MDWRWSAAYAVEPAEFDHNAKYVEVPDGRRFRANSQQDAGDECRLRFAASASLSFSLGRNVARMTISRPNLVRLIAAVMGLTASVWFVVTYTHYSHFRFKFEHEGGQLIAITEVLVPYGRWLYLLPTIALPIGLWLICCHRSHQKGPLWVEIG